MEKILDRFLRYVSVDTQSDPGSETQPSSRKQLDLLKMLKDELTAMGISADLDEYGYVMASIPSNCGKDVPPVGFIAHVDTSPDASGAGIKPQIIKDYDGKDILLDKKSGLSLKVSDFPELAGYRGQTIITTDGTTLLGADDKAGIAEIMSAIAWLQAHPEVKHGRVRVAFNPDEEIGMGARNFDVALFGCDWAYTMDGGEVGELEFENFNAAAARLTIKGRNVHPGYAKGKMINSLLVANRLVLMLPAGEVPEATEGYEGFFHLVGLEGTVEETHVSIIIRDHDRAKFEARKRLLADCVAAINGEYGDGTVVMELRDQYYNMREKVEPVIEIVDIAKQAMMNVGVTPKVSPIRGGTDGAQLSFKGLPCPNIFAGGLNFHGRYEFVPVQSMQKAVDVIVEIVRLVGEKKTLVYNK